MERASAAREEEESRAQQHLHTRFLLDYYYTTTEGSYRSETVFHIHTLVQTPLTPVLPQHNSGANPPGCN